MVPLAGRADKKKRKAAAANSKNGLEVSETNASSAEDALSELRSDDELLGDNAAPAGHNHDPASMQHRGNDETETGELPGGGYKVYKRRWFGLVQITLLNIVVSWDVSRADDIEPHHDSIC